MSDKKKSYLCDECGVYWYWQDKDKKFISGTSIASASKDDLDKNILLYKCNCGKVFATYDTGFERVLPL